VKRFPVTVAVVVLVWAVAFFIGSGIGNGLTGSQSSSPSAPIAQLPTAATSATPTGSPAEPTDSGQPIEPSPTPSTTTIADVPIVAVTQFRSTRVRTTAAEVTAVLAGTSPTYEALELVAGEADAILAALDMKRPADATQLILADDAATLTKDLAKHRKRLAFLRADAVGPAVRARGGGSE